VGTPLPEIPLAVLADGGIGVVTAIGQDVVIPYFSLETAASTVHAGAAYTSEVIPTTFEAGAADGTSQGKLRRTNRVALRFKDTIGGEWRAAGAALAKFTKLTLPWSGSTDNGTPTNRRMNTAATPFTGTVVLDWDGSYVLDDTIWLRQSEPLPMTLLSIFPQFTVYDR
jgi:hypothetical protein